MYERIVVPTDGSETAARAAREAFRIAEGTGATVHVVSVVDESGSTLLFAPESMGALLERLADEAEAAVENLAATAPDGVAVETDVVRAMQVYRGIVSYADRVGADLVVMGSQGRGGVGGVLGSTTERVASHTDLPVLVISEAQDEE